jgi:threonylcarbamoyladenosine tRNA methylthiotransferase MtaB
LVIQVKVFFQTLGCRLNEAELETWSSQFLQRGFSLAEDAAAADLLILNTCSVTGEADRKSRQQIRRLHRDNPSSRMVVTGCYASLQAERVRSELGVDLVVSNDHKDDLVDQVVESLSLEPESIDEPAGNSLFARGRHRAFIKVQDGCRYRCTYCIVTLARGEERSRPVDEIVDEINRLHGQGIQEAVITGVHVGGYGSDIGSSLYALLSELLERTGIPRLRLASVEPWDLPDRFFELFRDSRLMPHMHLPLQSGSDTVLRRMSRRCRTAEFEELVERARDFDPLFNITTDLIVGFPGETEEEWQQTLRFVEKVGFGHMHIFSFSPRSGTKAASLPYPVPAEVKKRRSREMHELASTLKRKSLRQHLGAQQEVLWERRLESGRWSGYTPYYHRVEGRDGRLNSSGIARVVIGRVSEQGDCLLAEDPLAVDLAGAPS